MAESEDVCASCSDKFADLKSAFLCSVCKQFFHGSCMGISDLRGMKRLKWKCNGCVQEKMPETKYCLKRYKSDSGDVVEVDRRLLENLLSTVEDLTDSVEWLKAKISSAENDNVKLHQMVSTLLKANPPVSFSTITKTNLDQVTGARPKKANLDTPFVFGTNQNTPALSVNNNQSFSAKQVKVAVSEALNNLSKAEPSTKEGDFQVVKSRKKKIAKPVFIGTKTVEPNDLQGTERRQWVYVGRIKAGTRTQAIQKYIETNFGISDVKCHQLMNSDDICSFKVGVRESSIAELLKPEKWPRQVAIREFVNFRSVKRNAPIAILPDHPPRDFPTAQSSTGAT